MDVLTDILGSLRLTGGVVIDGKLTGEFCVRSEFTPQHCAPFFPMPESLISYHYVRSGQMVVEVEGVPPVTVRAGEVVIVPRNDPHLLASRTGLRPADMDDVGWVTAEGVHHVASGSDGPPTEVWCGFLGTDRGSAHPRLDALPPLLTLDVGSGQEGWLESSMRFLAEERPSQDVVARLAELFLTQAVREYVDQLPSGAKGWLKGLSDPAVSRALAIIHARYAEDLTVEGLAREAGVSRTVLGERFVELLGEPPMRYCAHWRMRMAANMLRDGRHNTANIAYAVGFNSEAAFNRAFKREYGEPPATWRRRIEAQEDKAPPPTASKLPDDTIRTCRGRDGVRLAYATSGKGFPVMKAPNWMTHLEHDWTSPVYGHWIEELSRSNRLVRMDMRGFGKSDWELPGFTFEHLVSDLEAVADDAGIEQCDLLGISHGAAIALAFAARNPARVRKLIVVNGFAAGWRIRNDPEEIAYRESLLEMNRQRPSFRRSLLGEMFITLYFPSASQTLIDWHNEHFETLGPVKNMEPMIQLASRIDIREELAMIGADTLVCHAAMDGNAPVVAGQQIADAIRSARFFEFDSANHVPLGDEPAWPDLQREIRRFMGA
jgi:pimeloyl-ACP methyl ester carboxylesterase/AraC-like DNA-binding protein